ncbi:hypothetical protein EB809_04435 [Marinobacter sp. R17]|nr:hypothetical protein EB809_04435 [Marinobacter sp. R17]
MDAFIGDDVNKRRDARKDPEFLKNVRPILFDITPACDHAQDKAFWRRFLVGIIVYEKAKKHFYRDGGKKLPGEFLKATPKLQNGEDTWYLVLNSKLVVSIPDQAEYFSSRDREQCPPFVPMVSKLELVGRVREQMLQEFISWYGRMATRPGIVSLS